MGRRAGARTALLLVSLAVAGLVACGPSDDAVDEGSFERHLVEQEGLTPDQSRCVGRYVFAAYSPQDIETIREDGLTALPNWQWAEYGHAMVGCLFHDELTGTSAPTPPFPAGPGPGR
jgi:hypothetical protein